MLAAPTRVCLDLYLSPIARFFPYLTSLHQLITND